MDFGPGRYAQPHANSYNYSACKSDSDRDQPAHRDSQCVSNGDCDGNNASTNSYSNCNSDDYSYTYPAPESYTTHESGSASASDSASQTLSQIGEPD